VFYANRVTRDRHTIGVFVHRGGANGPSAPLLAAVRVLHIEGLRARHGLAEPGGTLVGAPLGVGRFYRAAPARYAATM
jgi:hypothetical protein